MLADFLIQDVCVYAPTADAAACADRRDVRPGENVLVLRTDAGTYQAVFSVPTDDGVLIVKDFGGATPGTTFGAKDACGALCTQHYVDGYDLIVDDGAFVSIAATSDGGRNDQLFWSASCTHEGAWLLFPSILNPGDASGMTGKLNISTGNVCPGTMNDDYTEWSYALEPFVYTSGKALTTIRSTHYDAASPKQATSFEAFYFTREYGFSRWESWVRQDACGVGCVPQAPLCNGAWMRDVGAQTFVRKDCRDSTYVRGTGDYNLASFVPVLPPLPKPPAGGGAMGLWSLLTLAAGRAIITVWMLAFQASLSRRRPLMREKAK